MVGFCRCGFGWCEGRPRPWRPEDLGALLEAHAEHGSAFEGAGKFKGYNEVYAKTFKPIGATRTTVSISALPTPIAVEFKVIARIPE